MLLRTSHVCTRLFAAMPCHSLPARISRRLLVCSAGEPRKTPRTRLFSAPEDVHDAVGLDSSPVLLNGVDDHGSLAVGRPWPPAGWSQSSHELHVFWDLDNKMPFHWMELPDTVAALRHDLGQAGRISSISAYANRATLAASTAEKEDLEELLLDELLEEEDELRCSLCGRHCKSLADLDKHFKQLHQREHKKRLSHPNKKSVKKYLESNKGQRYRDAYAATGMSSKLGSKGRTLKALLVQLGVRIREVPTTKQAADIALCADVNEKLKTRTLEAAAPKQRVLVIISDDYGFQPTLLHAQEVGWCTAVVSSQDKFLADAWLQWDV